MTPETTLRTPLVYLIVSNHDFDMALDACASWAEMLRAAAATFNLPAIPDGSTLSDAVDDATQDGDWRSWSFLQLDADSAALAAIPLPATGHSLLEASARLRRSARPPAAFGAGCPDERALVAHHPALAALAARWVWIVASTDRNYVQETKAFRSWRAGMEALAGQFEITPGDISSGDIASESFDDIGNAKASQRFWDEVNARYERGGWKGSDFWCLDPVTLRRASIPSGLPYLALVRLLAKQLSSAAGA